MPAPTWDQLLDEVARERLSLCRARLEGMRGCWDARSRTVWIDSRLSDRMAAPVLAHELVHVRRGDDGPQSDLCEQLIDERIASMWIEIDGYAKAEAVRGPDPLAIADELDLPQWVVEAFQRYVARRH